MQESHLKLKEIIWEITGECRNGCEYCGSKEVSKIKTPSHHEIMNIAAAIAEYPPEQIDISGGDPLLVSLETHSEITALFESKGIVAKILANPQSIRHLQKSKDSRYVLDVFNLYKWVGISINTPVELKMFKEFYENLSSLDRFRNFTVITNFNIVNLYDYETIEQFVIEQKVPWMVQFTVYPKGNELLAIYGHESAFDKLKMKIHSSIAKKVEVIISDNATTFACGAGKASIGILYNGDVVPCLSMRSWHPNLESEVQGNLFEVSLKGIWELGFREYRFGCFECCKDVCKNKIILDTLNIPFEVIHEEKEPMDKFKEILKDLEEKMKKSKTSPPSISPIVAMYAVSPGSGTVMYAVFPGNGGVTPIYSVPAGGTVAYAVYPPSGTYMYAVNSGFGNIRLLYGVDMGQSSYEISNPENDSKNVSDNESDENNKK